MKNNIDKYLKETESVYSLIKKDAFTPYQFKIWLKQSLESVELDTARKIGEAAGQAGLVPEDLANPEDWKNALQTLEKEVIEESYNMGYRDGKNNQEFGLNKPKLKQLNK